MDIKWLLMQAPIICIKTSMSESERVHFKIALPIELKKRLEHEAIEHRRSLSAEIIARLEDSLSIGTAESIPAPAMELIVERAIKRYFEEKSQEDVVHRGERNPR